MLTSLEQFPSKTSSIASIPWEETSCESISGASVRMASWSKVPISGYRMTGKNQMDTSWLQASCNWKSGAAGVSSSIN